MSKTVVAVLDDLDSIEKLAKVARELGLSVVLTEGSQRLSGVVARCEGARLLVMDIDALGLMGLEFCHGVRQVSDILIVAIGDRSDGAREAAVLKAGADSYQSKPVDVDLLQARIEALLRRSSRTPALPESVTVRGLTIDFARKEVRFGDELVPVTPAEYRLLACLASRPGRVVSSSELLKEMSGYDCPEQEAQEIVKVHVSRLRSKIDRDPDQPSYLVNMRGFGYILERRSGPLPTP